MPLTNFVILCHHIRQLQTVKNGPVFRPILHKQHVRKSILNAMSRSLIHTDRYGRQVDGFNEVWQQRSLQTDNIPLENLITAAHCPQSVTKLQSNPRLELVLLCRDRTFSCQHYAKFLLNMMAKTFSGHNINTLVNQLILLLVLLGLSVSLWKQHFLVLSKD